MRHMLLILILLGCIPRGFAEEATRAAGTQAADHDTHKVLLIGNSLTERNDLAAASEEALRRALPKKTYEIKAITEEGYSLKQHLEGEASDLLRTCEYEVVVLQERGSLTSSWMMNGARQHGYPKKYLDVVGEFVKLANACGTKVYVYQTWSQNADDMPYIRYANRLIEEEHQVEVIPIGDYVWAYRKDAQKPTFGADGYHPSSEGTLLAAALIADQVSGGRLCRGLALTGGELRMLSYERACMSQVPELHEAQRPSYVSEPVLEPLANETNNFEGSWTSTRGGTRLSFLTVMDFSQDNVVNVTEYTALARLREHAPVVVQGDGLAEFAFSSSGVAFNVAARAAEGELKILTRSGSPDRRSYATATYRRSSSTSSYQRQLTKLYDSLDAAKSSDELVSAVGRHYSELSTLLIEEGMTSLADQISPNEWYLLLPAASFERNGYKQRAEIYLQAATKIYGDSLDAGLAHADFLYRASKMGEARNEYLRVRGLASAAGPDRIEDIDNRIASIPK